MYIKALGQREKDPLDSKLEDTNSDHPPSLGKSFQTPSFFPLKNNDKILHDGNILGKFSKVMSLIITSPVPSIQGLSLYKMLPHVKENDVFPNLIFPYGSNSCGKPPSANYKVIHSSNELYVSIDLHVK